jgi:hypothetical protein
MRQPLTQMDEPCAVVVVVVGVDALETPEDVPLPETILPWSSTSATAAKFVRIPKAALKASA